MPTKLERLRAFCEAKPDDPFAWYSMAMEQRKTDVPGALATFQLIRERHPKYVPNYYHFADALGNAGDSDRAAEVTRAGMEIARAAGDMHAYGELEGLLDRFR